MAEVIELLSPPLAPIMCYDLNKIGINCVSILQRLVHTTDLVQRALVKDQIIVHQSAYRVSALVAI